MKKNIYYLMLFLIIVLCSFVFGELNVTTYYPLDSTSYASDSLVLNWSVNNTANECWYSLDGGTNTTLTEDLLCTQETANVSNSCGGLDTGTYSFEDNWQNEGLVIDGNDETFGGAQAESSGKMNVNYSKPVNLQSAWWKVIDGDSTRELVLDSTCKDANSDFYLLSLISSASVPTIYVEYLCNGALIELQSGYSTMYEEKLIMNLSTPINITMSSLSQGHHNLTMWCNESDGSEYESSINNFFVDSIEPKVTIHSPTLPIYSYSSIALNWSVIETNLDTCIYEVNGVNTTFVDWCLQETANESTSCGGLDTGIYEFSGDPWTNKNNLFDGDASTSGSAPATGTSYMLINLTIPPSEQGSTLWGVEDSGGKTNLTIPDDCRIGNISSLMVESRADIPFIWVKWYCWNSTWKLLREDTSGSDVYEERIHWNKSTNYNTTLTLTDGNKNITIYCNDTVGNSNYTTTSILVDATDPAITIFSPIDGTTYDNQSIDLNWSVIETNLDTCVYSINKGTNTTITGNISLTLTEGTYNATIHCNDSANNINFTTAFNFQIAFDPPSILLNKPDNNSYLNYKTNVGFNFTATDPNNIDICQLWTNFTGNWTLNETLDDIISSTSNITYKNLTDGEYIWNVYCNDTTGVGNFSKDNFTFTIDTTFPNINAINITTTTGSQTVLFNVSSFTEINCNRTYYSVYDTNGSIENSIENETLSCSDLSDTFVVSAYETYNLTIYMEDKAGNINSSNQTFTTTPTTPTTTTGEGGGAPPTTIPKTIIKEIAENFTILAGIRDKMDFVLAKESVVPRTKYFTVVNKGIDPINITLRCTTDDLNSSDITEESKLINICDFVEFDYDTIILSPNEAVEQRVMMMLSTPPNSTFGDHYNFNVIAERTFLESETVEIIQSAKLSVHSRVPLWGMMFKWSYFPLQDKELDKEERKTYPVAPIAVLLSFIIFTLIFLAFYKKMPLTGFSLSTLLFFISFGILLFVL